MQRSVYRNFFWFWRSILDNRPLEYSVWDEICALEQELQAFVREAYEYQNNTFPSHPLYYISYFEMRYDQCQVLHNLHYELKKIRNMPQEAVLVAAYIRFLAPYVTEQNQPDLQIERLKELCEQTQSQTLPQSREEFEGRAMLYHILMDLEEFLVYKERFIRELDAEQKRRYWH